MTTRAGGAYADLGHVERTWAIMETNRSMLHLLGAVTKIAREKRK